MKTRPLLRILAQGFLFGMMVAVLTSLILPLLFELYVFIASVFQIGSWYGPIGLVAPEIWLGITLDGARYFGAPNIIGGVLLIGIFYLVPHGSLRLPISFLFVGLMIGIAIAAIGLPKLTTVSSEPNGWLFNAMVYVWEAIAFGWMGQRLYRRTSLQGDQSS